MEDRTIFRRDSPSLFLKRNVEILPSFEKNTYFFIKNFFLLVLSSYQSKDVDMTIKLYFNFFKNYREANLID